MNDHFEAKYPPYRPSGRSSPDVRRHLRSSGGWPSSGMRPDCSPYYEAALCRARRGASRRCCAVWRHRRPARACEYDAAGSGHAQEPSARGAARLRCDGGTEAPFAPPPAGRRRRDGERKVLMEASGPLHHRRSMMHGSGETTTDVKPHGPDGGSRGPSGLEGVASLTLGDSGLFGGGGALWST